MSDWQEQFVIRDGIRLHYVRTSSRDKPPLVLCHGLTDNGLCWSRTAAALESDFDVLMPDARNHGQTGDGPAGVHDLAADISHLITSLGFTQVTVIGHSVGAAIAAAFGGDFPKLAAKLILEDPPWRETGSAPNPEKTAKQHAGFARYIEKMQGKSEDEIQALGKQEHPAWHEDDFPAWAASKKQVRKEASERLDLGNWSELVPRISCPTLLLYGDQDNGCDGIVTASMADKVTALNPAIRSQHIAGAGHNLRRERFDPFIKTVNAFLNDQQ